MKVTEMKSQETDWPQVAQPESQGGSQPMSSFVKALTSYTDPAAVSTPDPEDRRRAHRRVPTEAVVQLWVNSAVHDPHARTANISEEGMFVVTSRPLPVGTVARFEMALSSAEQICGFAEVVWLRPHFECVELPNGMGLRYVAVRDEGKELLRSFVLSHVENASKSNAKVQVSEQGL